MPAHIYNLTVHQHFHLDEWKQVKVPATSRSPQRRYTELAAAKPQFPNKDKRNVKTICCFVSETFRWTGALTLILR